MLPRLGRAITRATSNASFRPLVKTSISATKSIPPYLPARAFTVHTAKQQSTETKKKNTTPKTLDDYKNTGNLKGAVRVVQNAQEAGKATPALYLQLVHMLKDSPFDINACATVAYWFYSPNSKLSREALHDIDLWKNMLTLSFGFASTYRVEDLRALVARFVKLFDLSTLNDTQAWEILIRAYGILNKQEKLADCIQKSQQNNEPSGFSILLSLVATDAHEQVDVLVNKLKDNGQLTHHTLLKLIRCYGFNGDVEHTNKYRNLCNQLYPDSPCDKTMLLIAHKVALDNICRELQDTLGSRGLPLKPAYLPELDALHSSWESLTQNMLESQQKLDLVDCNVVLEYLTLANRIDPIQYPIERAEEMFELYMLGNSIQPNNVTYRIMLNGYATTQQYTQPGRNIRLDKTLELVSKMQADGIDTLNHPTFHALFRACLPHHKEHYYFDNFKHGSLLPSKSPTFNLDPRIFEIEQIMLDAKLPHDRFTFATLLTCLAAGGKYQALRSRWRALKLHGIRRDVGLYRLAFSLASLNPVQAKRAIIITRNEMAREIPASCINWETYVAMLDCCVAAKMPIEAKDIIREMRQATARIHRTKTHADDLAKWPFEDEPNYYLPMLRAAVLLPGLDANAIVKELDNKQVVYNKGIWEVLISKAALDKNEQDIRDVFNRYTMSRFEKEGKIPIPVRENSQPVIPFPTAPYTSLDMKFIDVYLGSLLDSQDLSLVFDVLRTLSDQTDCISISLSTIRGISLLAQQEKSTEDLQWFKSTILPKISLQNQSLKKLQKLIEFKN
ncbi:hypothetical protein EDC96DRAFT_522642 [Choanephora cucurbitarum]|nr:hypothetical protein EDC96DRAFT_522642 [Choanephora cucurbitarum]